ncbi:MAG TPA: DUF2177 family protein [Caulobacteraceae bacterium]
MIRWLAAYVGAAVVFAGLDAVWLTLTNGPIYRAVLFYVVYLAGVVLFAVRPALATRRWRTAAALGASFGFVAYATYDLTNQATLALWETQVTVFDLAWGTLVTAAGATAGYAAVRLTRV